MRMIREALDKFLSLSQQYDIWLCSWLLLSKRGNDQASKKGWDSSNSWTQWIAEQELRHPAKYTPILALSMVIHIINKKNTDLRGFDGQDLLDNIARYRWKRHLWMDTVRGLTLQSLRKLYRSEICESDVNGALTAIGRGFMQRLAEWSVSKPKSKCQYYVNQSSHPRKTSYFLTSSRRNWISKTNSGGKLALVQSWGNGGSHWQKDEIQVRSLRWQQGR